MRFLLATALAVAVLPGSAGAAERVAGVLTGEALLALCDGGDDRCTGYIAGVADGLALAYRYDTRIAGFRACIPLSVADRDIADLVTQFLHKHPEHRPQAAVGVVAHALNDTFPCPPLAGRRS